jgi:hypothetical protein
MLKESAIECDLEWERKEIFVWCKVVGVMNWRGAAFVSNFCIIHSWNLILNKSFQIESHHSLQLQLF